MPLRPQIGPLAPDVAGRMGEPPLSDEFYARVRTVPELIDQIIGLPSSPGEAMLGGVGRVRGVGKIYRGLGDMDKVLPASKPIPPKLDTSGQIKTAIEEYLAKISALLGQKGPR